MKTSLLAPALISCRTCAKPVASDAGACPHCGAPEPIPQRTGKLGPITPAQILAAVLVAVCGGVICYLVAIGELRL